MKATDKLKIKNNEGKFICVGLDTDINKIPPHLLKYENPIFEFNKAIIESCADYAAAFKFNFAFYERNGFKLFDDLSKSLSLIPKDILVIADAKRGDIGNTSEMYAKAILDDMNFDSITVNPYLGEDSVLPFLQNPEKLIFILTLTSNSGSIDFEKIKLENGKILFQHVIEKISSWNSKQNCGIVFGATNSQELQENIKLFGNLPVLLPGIGAQGGNLADVISTFNSAGRKDFIINVSRSLIYKSNGNNFAEESMKEIINLNNQIDSLFNLKKNL